MERAKGHVVFENVSFSYNAGRSALKDVSVEMLPGQSVALVGRPGSGKTTFAHLIPRFYDVTSGRITIDGVDVKEVTLASLRDNVGIVQQDVFIHSVSVRDNIAFGRVDAPLEKVVAVAQIAQLHAFITSLPDAYHTVVGERGVGLSGGQKQRLDIARTLLMNPPILILDDCTSSVDAHTEGLIQAALEQVVKDRTTFIITNRFSTIRNVGMILVFGDGAIVERGSHEELMALGGEYRELYEFQMQPQAASTRGVAQPSSDGRVQ